MLVLGHSGFLHLNRKSLIMKYLALFLPVTGMVGVFLSARYLKYLIIEYRRLGGRDGHKHILYIVGVAELAGYIICIMIALLILMWAQPHHIVVHH